MQSRKVLNQLIKERKMSDLSFELVFEMVNSEQEFPVSLDDAWQWIGYSRKESAKDRLVKHFDEGVDYVVTAPSFTGAVAISGFQAANKETILMSVDTFKQLAMMAGTQKGKEVRRYFLNCEKQLKELLKAQYIENKKDVKNLKLQIRQEHRKSHSSRKHVLTAHGVHPLAQRWITRQDYQIMFAKSSEELRKDLGISKAKLIVDHLEPANQATLSFGHMMQIESLETKNTQGYYPVKKECGNVMQKVVDFRNSLRFESNK